MALLTKGWVVALLGALMYLGVTAALLSPAKLGPAKKPGARNLPARHISESWWFFDPEADRLIKEHEERMRKLEEKEQQLRDWETRLLAEEGELKKTITEVKGIQVQLERFIIKLSAEEEMNLQKLAKTYAAITPDAASAIFKEMDDDQITKILLFMNPEATAVILEGLSKLGPAEAARAAKITEELRMAVKERKS